MEIGVTLPQLEIGPNPGTLLDYATRIEDAGYQHILAYDHVLGAGLDRDEWAGPYDYKDQFHEPLTTFSMLASHTEDIEYVTGILILPQRQTALVAKQAAQVDRFSDGNFRLGVGVGWNPLEYVALGKDFSTRGRQIEEQIELLNQLWTTEAVAFEGDFHEIPDVGINPLPIQQPIPIWMGGMADPVKRRVARLADGWLPQFQPDEEARKHMEDLEKYANEVGRDVEDIGIHGRMEAVPNDPDDWIHRVRKWKDFGADYLAINTMEQGFEGEEHASFLETIAGVLSETGFL